MQIALDALVNRFEELVWLHSPPHCWIRSHRDDTHLSFALCHLGQIGVGMVSLATLCKLKDVELSRLAYEKTSRCLEVMGIERRVGECNLL